MQLNLQGQFRRAVRLSLLASALGPNVIASVYAQDSAPPNTSNTPTELKGVVVTGSRIRRVEAEGPTPVETITSQQITNAGFSTIQQLFDNLSLNVGGSLGQNNTFGFTPGASGVDLRGFGVGRTLILLDGRRLPVYPVADSGTDNFVDLSSIPTAIVDRIEILTTGGSAIYGSDAISGVINIITKKKYKGLAGSVRAGGTEHGGYGNERAQLSYGFINESDSIVISGEIFHNDPLHASQRRYSQSDVVPGLPITQNYSVYGANYLDFDNGVNTPASNCQSLLNGAGITVASPLLNDVIGLSGLSCSFDRAKYRELYPAVDRSTLYSHFEHSFSVATLYVQGLYTNQMTEARFEPFPYYSPLIPAGAVYAPTSGSGYFYRRAVEFGPRGADVNNITYSILTGLKGGFDDYEWDTAVTRSQITSNDDFPSIISSVLNNAVCGGKYDAATASCTDPNAPGLNLLQPIPADVVQKSSYLKVTHAVSQTTSLDGTISGPLPYVPSLRGGSVQMAAYLGYEKEWYSDLDDPITSSGQGVDGGVSAQGNRSHLSEALEFSLPILKPLTLNMAGRYDNYNTNSGGQFTAQSSLQYRPVKPVLLRASIGSTFRAPDIQRLYGGQTTNFETAIDTVLCKNEGGTVGDGNTGHADCNTPVQSVKSISTGNPELNSEKGINYSFGFAVEPVERLTWSWDYFFIQLRDAVQSPTAQFILNQCAYSGQLCGEIQRDGQGTLQGQTAQVTESPLNTAGQSQKGFDTKVNYDFPITVVGKFSVQYTMTYLFAFKYQLNNETPEESLLNTGAVNGSFPRHRWTTSIDWTRGPYGADATWFYIPHVPGANSANPAEQGQYMPSFTQINLQGHCRLGDLGTIRLGVNNILGAHPPFDPTDDQNQFTSGAALSYSNSFGREGFVQYEFKF